eukprot:g73567.t1
MKDRNQTVSSKIFLSYFKSSHKRKVVFILSSHLGICLGRRIVSDILKSAKFNPQDKSLTQCRSRVAMKLPGLAASWSLLALWFLQLRCAKVQDEEALPYVDYTFSCPPLTEVIDCPPVCVNDTANCPDMASCAPGLVLCADGSCVASAGLCNATAVSPCSQNECGYNFSCAYPAQRNQTSLCDEMLGEYYEQAAWCVEDSSSGCVDPNGCLLSAEDAPFIVVYVWILGIAFLSVLWCAFNQRMYPRGQPAILREIENMDRQLNKVPRIKSQKSEKMGEELLTDEPSPKSGKETIEMDSLQKGNPQAVATSPDGVHYKSSGDVHLMIWTQTGYRASWIGDVLYLLVMLTTVGFQVLLLLLVLMYYAMADGILEGEFYFKDQKQALAVFEVVWSICVVWWVFLKWPTSVYSLFLRRCPLNEAEYVAVFTEKEEGALMSKDNESLWLVWSKWLVFGLNKFINWFCRALFSDRSTPAGRIGDVEICRVDITVRSDGKEWREFKFHLCQYILDTDTGVFKAGKVNMGDTLKDLTENTLGLSNLEVLDRRAMVGPNEVRMRDPSFFTSLVEEFSKIFYVYQNMMAWSWFNFAYWHMGIVNTFVYITGGISVAWYSYLNEKSLSTLTKIEGRIMTRRDGQWTATGYRELVPGDICQLEPGVVQCDMVLISHPAVADESSLTGESMPVVKVPLTETAIDLSENYEPQTHKKHTIFAGTSLLKMAGAQGEHRSVAIVTRTGAQTLKGELLRNILFSARPRFSFDVEIELVLCVLLMWAVVAFSITMSFLKTDPVSGWFYSMYVVATCLPPLLPTVFVVAVGISSQRLLKERVICTDPKRLLMAGKVRVAAFDKTGTLTKQGLDFLTVHSCHNGTFSPNPEANEKVRGLAEKAVSNIMARGMAVCHTVSMVEGTMGDMKEEDKYVGNSVDVQMFKASGYSLHMSVNSPDRVHFEASGSFDRLPPVDLVILQRFDFDHRLSTQSSVVRDESQDGPEKGKVFVYAKGSAEAIKARCSPETVPADFDQVANSYSKEGLYVIALSRRDLQAHEVTMLAQGDKKLQRDRVEEGLTFLGFMLFKNEVKPDTAISLEELRKGDVRTLMVSGDHVLTAIHVGKKTKMLPPGRQLFVGKLVESAQEGKNGNGAGAAGVVWEDESGNQVELPQALGEIELAVTGKVFNALEDSGQLDALLTNIRILGRMTPGDKVRLVQHYVNKGWITLFCGDGGNDCGALRTAHVGVALSETEASVVSPFTALDKTCKSVVDVLIAGRCALSGSFSSYKYMLMYGQVETLNQIVNAYLFITFSEWCWVWMDGIWVVLMAFTLPLANHPEKLADSRPTSSLLGPYTLVSFLGILAINFSFLCIALGALYAQDWFQCRQWTSIDVTDATIIGDNYESSVIFIVSGWQYVASAMAFNFGGKHRAGWWDNWRFVLLCVIFFVCHMVVTLYPSKFSCVFRVNCDNEDICRFATTGAEPIPIQNSFHTTVMPMDFRGKLCIIFIVNTIVIMLWERLLIYGFIGDWVRAQHPRKRFLNL